MHVNSSKIHTLQFQGNSSAHQIKQKFQELYSRNMTIFLQVQRLYKFMDYDAIAI